MSKRASAIFCVLLLVILFSPVILQFVKTVSAQGELPITTVISDVISTSDGGFVAAGYRGVDLLTYLYIAKYDSSGSTQWIRDYGEGKSYAEYMESAIFDKIYSIVQADDGGYTLVGTTGSYGAIGYDFWLVKTDTTGRAEWNKTYGGADSDQAYSITKTNDRGYAIAGWTRSFNLDGGLDFYLVKVDSAGIMQWNKTYSGDRNDWAYVVIQTSDGGYALAGDTNSYGLGGDTTHSYGYDAWLVKTDSSGNIRWNQTYGNSTGNEVIYSLIETSDGGYALGGRSGHLYSDDAFMVRTDSSGTKQWNLFLSQPGNSEIHAVTQTIDEGYVFAGSSAVSASVNLNFLIVKTSASGIIDWSKTYGGENDEEATLIVQTDDGGYKAIGSSESTNNSDLQIVQTSSSGVSPQYSQSPTPTGTDTQGLPFNNVYLLVVVGIVVIVIVVLLFFRFRRKRGIF